MAPPSMLLLGWATHLARHLPSPLPPHSSMSLWLRLPWWLKREPPFDFDFNLFPIVGIVVFQSLLLQALPSCSSIHLLWSWQCWPPQWPAGPGCRCASESPSCWTSHLLRRGGDLHEVLGLICSRPEPPCSTGTLGALLPLCSHFFHSHGVTINFPSPNLVTQPHSYHNVPLSTTLYWPSTTMYQLALLSTDQVTPSTNDYHYHGQTSKTTNNDKPQTTTNHKQILMTKKRPTMTNKKQKLTKNNDERQTTCNNK